jgi:hypothetical protein
MTHTIHRAVNHRDPFSYPRLENDETFSGHLSQEKIPFKQEDIPIAQRAEPWNRLYSTSTLSSGRHEIYTNDPKAPLDSLDFILKSQYDQHNETFAGKARTCIQLETISDDHGYVIVKELTNLLLLFSFIRRRILKNRVIYKVPVPTELNHPLRIVEDGRKEHISEPEQAIRKRFFNFLFLIIHLFYFQRIFIQC